jgi:hypothetical protein
MKVSMIFFIHPREMQLKKLYKFVPVILTEHDDMKAYWGVEV